MNIEYITTEFFKLKECLQDRRNYDGIYNIEVLGAISKIYNNILSRHKSSAKKHFDELDPRSKTNKKLSIMWDYFYPNSVFRTYTEWQRRGRQVKKGEKSFRRNEYSVALFEYSQTKLPEHVARARHYNNNLDQIFDGYDEDEYFYEWEQEW